MTLVTTRDASYCIVDAQGQVSERGGLLYIQRIPDIELWLCPGP